MISVFLVVQNEERNIVRVLESVKQYDDIVIVDSGSTDRTLELARQYTDRIYHQDWLGMAKQKAFAQSLCQHEWVLNLDADEEVTPELQKEIDQVVSEDQVAGASIPFQEFFLGKKIHPKTKKNRHIRLFKSSLGQYGEERDHETLHLQGEVVILSGVVNHYGEFSVAIKVNKINQYSSSRALDKFDKGRKSSLLKLVGVFPVMFMKSYFFRRNFLNGRRGFIASVINAFYAFLKEAKLFEQEIKREMND